MSNYRFYIMCFLLLILLGVLGVLFLFKLKERKENFKDKPKPKPKPDKDSIVTLVKLAKDNINATKDKWLIYNATKMKNEYVLTPSNSKEIKYKTEIEKSGDKNIYTINDKDGNFSGTRGVQNKDDTTVNVRFNQGSATIKYSRNFKRLTITVNHTATTPYTSIIGYGGFPGQTQYPDPWYHIIPIVYKDGGTIIGLMDYTGTKVKSKDTYLPLEIIISKNNEKYLPLFFQAYVFLQEYISVLR